MKTSALIALLLASAASLLSAAETARIASPIAGFIAFDVPGATDSAHPQLSLKSIGLVRPVEFEGTAESLRGKVLIDKDATWREGEFGAADRTAATLPPARAGGASAAVMRSRRTTGFIPTTASPLPAPAPAPR